MLPHREQLPLPEPGVDKRPSDAEIAADLSPRCPPSRVHVGVVLAGRPGAPRLVGERTAGELGRRRAGRAAGRRRPRGVELRVTAGDNPPWHPGRCAMLRVGDFPVGFAGELHPKVIDALGPAAAHVRDGAGPRPAAAAGRPAGAAGVAVPAGARSTSRWSPHAPVPAAELTDALLDGGGDLLEDVRLFDVYTGEQVGAGNRSLAYTLRFRAPDRTLTSEEANTARDAAVAVAAQRHGARLR